MQHSSESHGLFHEILFLRPLQRVILSLIAASITWFFLRYTHLNFLLIISLIWTVLAFTFVATSILVFFTMKAADIEQRANKEDGSRIFVLIILLVSATASMFTILLLFLSDKMPGQTLVGEITGVADMILSWTLVHTIFTFHYAHLYYFDGGKDSEENPILDFKDQKKPDYFDFAYFSFCLGMTFQVSDVEIHSSKMRRVVLGHCLLAFAFNTFVVALTINLIAGLKN